MEDFLPFSSQTWPSLENHNSKYLTDLKNFFLSRLVWRKRTSGISCHCLCLSKPDKPKYFYENESSSFSFRIIFFLKVNLLVHEEHPSPSLDFLLLASLCSELRVRQHYQPLLLLLLHKT